MESPASIVIATDEFIGAVFGLLNYPHENADGRSEPKLVQPASREIEGYRKQEKDGPSG